MSKLEPCTKSPVLATPDEMSPARKSFFGGRIEHRQGQRENGIKYILQATDRERERETDRQRERETGKKVGNIE